MRLESFLGLLQGLLRVVDFLLDVRGLLLGLDEGRTLPLDGILLLPDVRVDFGELALALAVFLLGLLQLLLRRVLLLLDLGQVLALQLGLFVALLDAALVVEQLEQLELDLEIKK